MGTAILGRESIKPPHESANRPFQAVQPRSIAAGDPRPGNQSPGSQVSTNQIPCQPTLAEHLERETDRRSPDSLLCSEITLRGQEGTRQEAPGADRLREGVRELLGLHGWLGHRSPTNPSWYADGPALACRGPVANTVARFTQHVISRPARDSPSRMPPARAEHTAHPRRRGSDTGQAHISIPVWTGWLVGVRFSWVLAGEREPPEGDRGCVRTGLPRLGLVMATRCPVDLRRRAGPSPTPRS